jgi:hypothetical protein
MKFKVQVVTLLDDGEESWREVACIERDELSAVSLGLSITDSKDLLQGIQEVVVEWQMNAYLDTQRHCPQCGELRHLKGSHHTVFRTVFGDVPVESPRFTHCPCQGHVFQALEVLTSIHLGLEMASWERDDDARIGKLCKTVQEFYTFIERNRAFIPNYGERYRNGERISTGFVESTVNQVVSKRMVKKQQMRWSQRGAHLLLQIRTRVLNGEWEAVFRRWYPGFRAQAQPVFA